MTNIALVTCVLSSPTCASNVSSYPHCLHFRLKTEVVYSSETFVLTYQIARCRNKRDYSIRRHRCVILISYQVLRRITSVNSCFNSWFFVLKIVSAAHKLDYGQHNYGIVFRLPVGEKLFPPSKPSRLGLGPHSLPLNGYFGLSLRL